MEVLVVQPYIKVHREVVATEQRHIEYKRNLYLYKDRIVSQYHEFPIQRVRDISYRSIAGEGGTLYLHTDGGLYTYTVTSSPQNFIDVFKELINK